MGCVDATSRSTERAVSFISVMPHATSLTDNANPMLGCVSAEKTLADLTASFIVRKDAGREAVWLRIPANTQMT
jgi:hypothetical protein